MERLSRLTPATIDVLKMLVAAEGPVWGLQLVKTTGRPSGSVRRLAAAEEFGRSGGHLGVTSKGPSLGL